MKPLSLKYLFLIVAFGAFAAANAQIAVGSGSGSYLNYNDYINYGRSAGGDVEIDNAGYMQVGPLGLYDIYGAVINKGVIEVNNGGVLNIWGDMVNNGTIIVHEGGTINFYGRIWKNAPTATVTDGAAPNVIPGGDLLFIGNRPSIPSSWIVTTPYLDYYSGGDSMQFADGGNVAMDIKMRINNPKNVFLINTPTRIEGKLQWDVADGNIVLGNQDLIMNTNASQDGFREDRFAITNGTGHLVKENYTGNWIFPVGISNGDYTPAAINNTIANTMHVSVQDYANSVSEEGLEDGIDRTWNIYADLAKGNSLINLQHNSITNRTGFSEAYNFVSRWGSVIPNTTGDNSAPIGVSAWQSNFGAAGSMGTLTSTFIVAGSYMRSRSYTDFATSPSDPIAYYTKVSNIFSVPPVKLLFFTAVPNACEVLVSFNTGQENSISKYQIQRSTDGYTYTAIANIDPKGSNSSYSFVDLHAANGRNLYRLVMIEPSGDYTISNIETVIVDCEVKEIPVILFPNPATNYVTLSGLPAASEIRILNTLGRLVIAASSVSNNEIIDISQLPVAHYVVSVIVQGKPIAQLKLIKL